MYILFNGYSVIIAIVLSGRFLCVFYGCCIFFPLVYGALLGLQKGRSVEISNSFELLLQEEENGVLKLNKAYFTAKEEQCKSWQLEDHIQLFSSFKLV